MPDILHDFPIFAPVSDVFRAVSTPAGLDGWWTETCTGQAVQGQEYELGFGPAHQWRARVTRVVPGRQFELELTRSDADWNGTKVGFDLESKDGATQVRFHHTGWPQANDHYRTSCFCWAMYLRLMKKYVERGERVAYPQRLEA